MLALCHANLAYNLAVLIHSSCQNYPVLSWTSCFQHITFTVIPEHAVVVQVACGATSSMCTMIGEQLVTWGKLKASGDNTMVHHNPRS